MSPEEDVIDSSSLTKFRRLRLQNMDLLDVLIGKTVEIGLEKGLTASMNSFTLSNCKFNHRESSKLIIKLKLHSELRNFYL